MSVTAASDCVNDVELSRFIYSESGALLGHYDRCIASTEDVVYLDATPIARVKDGEIFPLEADHLGSPRAMQQPDGTGTDWSWGLLANTASGSNAFGEQEPTGKQTFNLRFPGQYADGNGLSYNYFRDYEAGTGRYVESDPIGLNGGIALYRYGLNLPLRMTDRKGLVPDDCRTYDDFEQAVWARNHSTPLPNCVPPPDLPPPPPTGPTITGTICRATCAAAAAGICAAIGCGCTVGTVITVGALSIPCTAVIISACASAAGAAVVCSEQMCPP